MTQTNGIRYRRVLLQLCCTDQRKDFAMLHPVSIHQMAPPKRGSTRPITALLLIYRPRKYERLSWPSWSTCSGRFTYVSGHPRQLQAKTRLFRQLNFNIIM